MHSETNLVQFEIERSNGSKAQTAWDVFIGPYCERKMKDLFATFIITEHRDVEGLQGIKMQAKALEGLKAEILGYIETGKMADISLNEHEATHKDANKEMKDE